MGAGRREGGVFVGRAVDRVKTRWWAGWWRVAAGFIAAVFAVGVVFQFFEGSTGPWYKHVFGTAILLVAPVLIVAGLVARRQKRILGNRIIAVGVLPGVAAIILFWFPPALLFGVLSIAVLVTALTDADKQHNV